MSQVFGVLAIGNNGEFSSSESPHGIPFRSSKDMKWFKALTTGKRVVISQKTLNLIPNGLPDREIYIASREGIKSPHGGYMTLGQSNRDVYVLGGAQVFLNYLDSIEYFFISVLGDNAIKYPVSHPYLPIRTFTEKFDVVFAGQSKTIDPTDKDVNLLYVLKNKSAIGSTLPKEIIDLIYQEFEPYIKLHLSTPVSIRPGAQGSVQVNELVCVPYNQTGQLSIRLSLAERGVFTEGTGFKSNWHGRPTVVITNRSKLSDVLTIDLKADDEIGEISFANNRSL